MIMRMTDITSRGEKALLIGMIERAALDLTLSLDSKHHQDAAEWFVSDADDCGAYSFIGACGVLGIDPEKTRRRVMRFVAGIKRAA